MLGYIPHDILEPAFYELLRLIRYLSNFAERRLLEEAAELRFLRKSYFSIKPSYMKREEIAEENNFWDYARTSVGKHTIVDI